MTPHILLSCSPWSLSWWNVLAIRTISSLSSNGCIPLRIMDLWMSKMTSNPILLDWKRVLLSPDFLSCFHDLGFLRSGHSNKIIDIQWPVQILSYFIIQMQQSACLCKIPLITFCTNFFKLSQSFGGSKHRTDMALSSFNVLLLSHSIWLYLVTVMDILFLHSGMFIRIWNSVANKVLQPWLGKMEVKMSPLVSLQELRWIKCTVPSLAGGSTSGLKKTVSSNFPLILQAYLIVLALHNSSLISAVQ